MKARPPTFAIFTTRPEDVPESYLRYLANGLRDRFGMAGTADPPPAAQGQRTLRRPGLKPAAGT